VKSLSFSPIKGLPKEAACPKASQNSDSSWDTLRLRLQVKSIVSHAELNSQAAAGTRGFRRATHQSINPSKHDIDSFCSFEQLENPGFLQFLQWMHGITAAFRSIICKILNALKYFLSLKYHKDHDFAYPSV
jgi:hypothetical protein